MGKGKPRHNPNKPANNWGGWCSACEEFNEDDPETHYFHCDIGVPSHIVETVCKCNPHNCCKVAYRQWAGKGDANGVPHC